MAKGDHIFVKRFGFSHHAIDLGDGTVIEYGGKSTGTPSIRRVWHNEFSRGSEVFFYVYPPGTSLHPDVVVENAWSRLGEQRYDTFDNNCEQFAFWCKTGKHWSAQAEDAKGLIRLVVAVAGLSLVATALADD